MRLRPPDPPPVPSRDLTCVRCGDLVEVIELAQGARTIDEHHFIDPAAYTCSLCIGGDTRRQQIHPVKEETSA